jgi:hypothetical protein
MYAPLRSSPLPRAIDLLADRKEERDVGAYNSWVADPVVKSSARWRRASRNILPSNSAPRILHTATAVI